MKTPFFILYSLFFILLQVFSLSAKANNLADTFLTNLSEIEKLKIQNTELHMQVSKQKRVNAEIKYRLLNKDTKASTNKKTKAVNDKKNALSAKKQKAERQRLAELIKSNQTLKTQLQSATRQLKDATNKVAQLQTLKTQLQSATRQLKDATNKVAQSQTLKTQLQNVTQQLKDAADKMAQLQTMQSQSDQSTQQNTISQPIGKFEGSSNIAKTPRQQYKPITNAEVVKSDTRDLIIEQEQQRSDNAKNLLSAQQKQKTQATFSTSAPQNVVTNQSQFERANAYLVNRDYQSALRLYVQLAQAGYIAAQMNAGNMYYEGVGIKKNAERAYLFYLSAAQKGDSEAQYNVGLMLQTGDGVQKDDEAAHYWYVKSANQGYEKAELQVNSP